MGWRHHATLPYVKLTSNEIIKAILLKNTAIHLNSHIAIGICFSRVFFYNSLVPIDTEDFH